MFTLLRAPAEPDLRTRRTEAIAKSRPVHTFRISECTVATVVRQAFHAYQKGTLCRLSLVSPLIRAVSLAALTPVTKLL
jgi:hypothetical protein